MAELYRYVAGELGGQHYRVIVLGSQEHPVYEGRLAVALPPKLQGRFVDRDQWDQAMTGRYRGTSSSAQTTTQQQHAPARSGDDAMVTTLIKLLFEQQKASSDATLNAVRDMTTSTHTLVRDVMQHRETETERRSLSEQLGEFAETSRAVQRLGRAFGAAAPDAGAGESSPLQQAAEQAFLTSVMGSMVGGGNHRRAPAQGPVNIPTSRPIPVRPQK